MLKISTRNASSLLDRLFQKCVASLKKHPGDEVEKYVAGYRVAEGQNGNSLNEMYCLTNYRVPNS